MMGKYMTAAYTWMADTIYILIETWIFNYFERNSGG